MGLIFYLEKWCPNYPKKDFLTTEYTEYTEMGEVLVSGFGNGNANWEHRSSDRQLTFIK